MESDLASLSGRSLRPRAVRSAGGAELGTNSVDWRRPVGELWRAGAAIEPVGALPARVGSGTGGGGRIVSQAIGRDGGGLDGSAQGRRRLSAIRPGVSAGEAG